jgi:hypothetical protein
MPQPYSSTVVKRSVLLGLSVGALAQLGLRTLLPTFVLVAVRLISLNIENDALWLESPGDSTHPLWYALQASVFVGSVIAGAIGAYLAPGRSLIVPFGLVVLSLLTTAFEQFPSPLSMPVLLAWTAGPCFGLVCGVLLVWHLRRGDA